ncbi:MAG: squalene--hopene cyclase [Planctomycetota bacterium]|nr:squalene--hopene cyclase [Planctomycetota bacterium]MDA1138145.1 squalene--hopene cyclase [Planctomycetota bacterium]
MTEATLSDIEAGDPEGTACESEGYVATPLGTDRGNTTRSNAEGQNSALREAIARSQNYLLGRQHEEGYWCGFLGNWDGTLVSDYIMLMHFLGAVNESHVRKGVKFILSKRNEAGGWGLYPGAPSDVSATVKAYFALKLAGYSAEDPIMKGACAEVLRMGGMDKVNSFTKIYLAMFGVFGWNEVPAVPPELMFMPETFYLNVWEMSSWSRAILVPLTIIWATKPLKPLPAGISIAELFSNPRQRGLDSNSENGRYGWEHFFYSLSEIAKTIEKLPFKPWRKKSLAKAEEWMLERVVPGGLGAVYPSMMNAVVAMDCLGYAEDHPKRKSAMDEFMALMIEEDDRILFQPCFSPVWDTAICSLALGKSGLGVDHPQMEKAARWMAGKECRFAGDWFHRTPVEPVSGWYFEFHNQFYPDVDDTVMVMMALDSMGAPGRINGVREAMDRGLKWLFTMQGADGGWGAFDRDNNKEVFEKVPFADHNAMLDPSTADLTSRMLEHFGPVGVPRNHPAVIRAVDFIKREQEPEGCWYGRWGVNYIYGTWQVLRGMAQIGEDMVKPWLQRGAGWLFSIQNEDGGWGESCDSYEHPELKGIGPSTPSQTAWALMGLIAAGHASNHAVQEGIRYLIETQNPDGSWDEDWFTGTGFPKVYYLEYTMYRHYFPLLALSHYRDD